jgi:hypothetical protein
MTAPFYNIEIIESPSDEIIHKAIELDHKAFQESDWITKEDAYLIYHNKNDCLIWLTQDDQPIGLTTIFPLNRNVPLKAIETNKPIYKLLTRETLTDPDTHILYCHCFLILPQFRQNGWIYKLYEGLGRWLEQKGAGYSSLYSDAVSEEGRYCLERLSFTSIHSFGEEGELYKGDKKSIISAITSKVINDN